MTINYKGIILNDPGETTPWGEREQKAFKDIIDMTERNLQEVTDFGKVTNNSISVGAGSLPAEVLQKQQIDSLIAGLGNPDYLDFVPQTVDPSYLEGRTFYKDSRKTLAVQNDKEGFNLELGRTSSSPFIADEAITKGQPLYVSSSTPGDLHVAIASTKRYNENWVIGVAGNTGGIGDTIEFVQRGSVTGMDTSNWATGIPLYLGDGVITDERPQDPVAEFWFIGAVVFQDAANGVLGVSANIDPYNITLDGNIVEQQNTSIVVDGGLIYMDIANEDPTRDLPFQLKSMEHELATITPEVLGKSRVQLIAGTATVPQFQTIYIELVGTVPTLKVTAGTPPEVSCLVAYATVLDATATLANEALLHRRITSAKSHDGTGTMAHVLIRLSQIPPEWESGVTPTATTDGTDMQLSVIAGKIWQTHLQEFPALSIDTSGVYVANGPGGVGLANYTKFLSLSDLMGWTSFDLARDTSCTGQLVIFGLINKDTQTCKIMANLPVALQASTAAGGEISYFNKVNDAVFTAPSDLKYTAFSLARIPYRLNGGVYQFVDPDGAATNDGSFIINRTGQPMSSSSGAAGNGVAATPPLIDVLPVGADAGGITITNAGNAVNPQDLIPLAQTEALVDTKPDLTGSEFQIPVIDGAGDLVGYTSLRRSSTGNLLLGADPSAGLVTTQHVSSVVQGDLFPSMTIERQAGITKENALWETLVGTGGEHTLVQKTDIVPARIVSQVNADGLLILSISTVAQINAAASGEVAVTRNWAQSLVNDTGTGWKQLGTSGVYFTKMSTGLVMLRFDSVSVPFTIDGLDALPVGFRPSFTAPYIIYGFGVGSPGANWVEVSSVGVVENTASSATLNGTISFIAEL